MTELRHQFVVITARDFKLFQMRSVSLDVDGFAGLGKNGLFGEVRKDHHEQAFPLTWDFIREASALHFDGIQAFDAPIRTVNIKLTLI